MPRRQKVSRKRLRVMIVAGLVAAYLGAAAAVANSASPDVAMAVGALTFGIALSLLVVARLLFTRLQMPGLLGFTFPPSRSDFDRAYASVPPRHAGHACRIPNPRVYGGQRWCCADCGNIFNRREENRRWVSEFGYPPDGGQGSWHSDFYWEWFGRMPDAMKDPGLRSS